MLFQSKTKHIKARQPVWQWLVVRAHCTADEISNTLSLVRTCAPQSDLSANYLVGVERRSAASENRSQVYFQERMKSSGCGVQVAWVSQWHGFFSFFPNSFDSTLWTALHNCDIERMEEPIGVAQYECRIRKVAFLYQYKCHIKVQWAHSPLLKKRSTLRLCCKIDGWNKKVQSCQCRNHSVKFTW